MGSGPGRCSRWTRGSKKCCGIVERLGLHVLRQRQRHGTAGGRVREDGDGGGKALEELLGARDPVPVPRDGPEAVVGGDGRVAEILDLLEDRIRKAVGEDVAGEEQHRQAIDVGDRGGGDHVRGAGTDRRRAGHHAPPRVRLRVRDGRVSHGLLVVRPERRDLGLGRVERLAEPRHVAVAEDRPDASEERRLASIDLCPLGAEEPHQRLSHRQPNRGHFRPPGDERTAARTS